MMCFNVGALQGEAPGLELLWGELWGPVTWRHPLNWRRRDVAEQLLAAGAGRMPEAEDLDY